MKKKSVALLLALGMVVGSAIGGSLAWLHDTSSEVVNTFAPSTINITLNESHLKADGTLDTGTKVTENNDYKMIPGATLPKDPVVTVEKGSEACWLFIKVEEVDVSGDVNGKTISRKVDDFLTYTIDPQYWTQLAGVEGVYYYNGEALKNTLTQSKSFNILKDNQVLVNTNVTKEMMDDLIALTKSPKLKFTAYASQYENGRRFFTAPEAWGNITGQ